jgi:3-oxoacyl-[acyl-carrier-protein] synthase-1
MYNYRVVSVGSVHPSGFSADELFKSLVEGKTGLREIHAEYLDKPVYAACFSDEQNRKLDVLCPCDGMNRFEKLLVAAGREALRKANLKGDEKIVLVAASTKGAIETENENTDMVASVKRAGEALLPGAPCAIVSNACISGLAALIAAKRRLATGDCDYALVVGADTVSDFVLSGFNALLALSKHICKPFDRDRDGINLGEGAAAILLRRTCGFDAGIYLTGGAITNDANHISGPSRTGAELAEAIRRAAAESGGGAFDFLSAHGTATSYNDEMESKAFFEAGLADVPMHGLKAFLGHTLGAAGIIESVVCVKSLIENTLIPSAGYTVQGTSCALRIQTKVEHREIKRIIKTMSGFGGCNAAVCFEKK